MVAAVGVWSMRELWRELCDTVAEDPVNSCPGMGERAMAYCCSCTGSTEAWTELVDKATLRKMFRAIQSLRDRKVKIR
jgi:hypothetical protein